MAALSLPERLRMVVRSPVALVTVVALVARIAALLDGMDAPGFDYPVIDARTYDQAARALAAGEGFDYRFFWQPFFYPVVLALSHVVSGGSILFAKLGQILLGVATCALTARCAIRLLGRGPGLVAGLICALHGPMIFFETELVATGWACFWAILLLDRLTGSHTGRRAWFLTGLLCGLAVLTRPTFLPALVGVLAWLAWRMPRTDAGARLGLVFVGFAMAVLPVAWIGQATVGYPGFLPASGAMNLYLGNHPEPCETLTIRPGGAWEELGLAARPERAGDLDANRDYFARELGANLTAHPGVVVRGTVRKSLQVLSSRELPRNVDPYGAREWSTVLGALMFKLGNFGFPGGVILPLALVGAWFARRRMGGALLVFTGLYLLAIVVVFVSARYRMPLVPAMAILAAAGLSELGGAIRRRQGRRIRGMTSALLASGILVTLPGPFCEEQVDYRGETLYAVAYAQHAAGELGPAAATYAMAVEQSPRNAELLNQFALLRSQQGRTGEAIELWTRALRVDPQDYAARMNLAQALLGAERHAEALVAFEAALKIRPADPVALLGSGFALLGVARFDEGIVRCERAVTAQPELASRLAPVPGALRGVGRADLADRLDQLISRAGGR